MSATFPSTGLVLLLFDQSGTMAMQECTTCDGEGEVTREIFDRTSKKYGVREKRTKFGYCEICDGGGVVRNQDAQGAFFSSLKSLREKQYKGQVYRDNFKIGVAIYHRYVAMSRVGFAREWNVNYNDEDEDWIKEAKEFDSPGNQTTNIIAVYKWALDQAKRHREEYPDSTITILNITDGEHNEFDPNPAMVDYVVSKDMSKLKGQLNTGARIAKVTDIADEIIKLDLEQTGTVRRCILGYLWYGSESSTFPIEDNYPENPPVRCSRLPGEFITALTKHDPNITRRFNLSAENPPMFFMGGGLSYANIADFISIRTSTQGDLPISSDGTASLFDSEGEFD